MGGREVVVNNGLDSVVDDWEVAADAAPDWELAADASPDWEDFEVATDASADWEDREVAADAFPASKTRIALVIRRKKRKNGAFGSGW
jgi:hypothetical protein